jgi:hypothetical protein
MVLASPALGIRDRRTIEMSVKKNLLALAIMAMATVAFASSAMAGTGRVLDVNTGAPIPENHQLHYVGWAKFSSGTGSYTCHVTAVIKATGTAGATGQVTQFTVPDTSKCTGTGSESGCKLKGYIATNLPYHVTPTAGGVVAQPDFDVTGNIVIHKEYENCFVKGTTLTFSEITLIPLKTGTTVATGTAGKLGTTAKEGEPIAGVELSGIGEYHLLDFFSETTGAVTASGELELAAADRCTWKLVKA